MAVGIVMVSYLTYETHCPKEVNGDYVYTTSCRKEVFSARDTLVYCLVPVVLMVVEVRHGHGRLVILV